MGIGKDNSEASCFNIYYLNLAKVYEIAMMIDNVILSSVRREKASQKEGTHSLGLSCGLESKKYLANIKAVIGAGSSERRTDSSKIIEALDVKTTKSILLRQIIEQCKICDTFTGLREGDLIKLDNVQLRILNEENLRQILMLRRDALKGLRIEGVEINNIISSMLQDYSYVLAGSSAVTEEIVIKIPIEIENEFESKYNVDDLLIGHVSVIGVFKGSVTESFINANTFNYLASLGGVSMAI
ncbi:MAG: hypothetical protein GX322_00005 [Firmicutes bacterium]|nr:hypothetical protein [Bacillota bacterium]